jgi:isopentenyl-diphosphate Delta-isomerase
MSEHSVQSSREVLDVVDMHGDPTGQTFDKRTIHDRGLPHRDVHVWVTNGRDMLQQQRTWDTRIMPQEWDVSVGGHVDAGESYLDAAVREAQEELGLELPRERFVRIGRVASKLLFPGWQAPHNIVGDNFVVLERDLTLADLALQEEEVLGARWCPIDQLEYDLENPATAQRHAPQPAALYALGIAGMRGLAAQ